MKKIFHPSVLGQGISLVTSVILVALLSRLLPTNDYAIYVMTTALWAIGNAVIGTAIGTRVAREAAGGALSIKVSRAELSFAVMASIAVGAYVLWSTSMRGAAVFSSLAMFAFVVAEVRIAFEIGRRRFRRYITLLAIRTVLPLILFYGFGSVLGYNLMLAVAATAIGNIGPAFMWPRDWGVPTRDRGSHFGQSVGSLNLGLWLIASIDRVLMQQFSDPSALAVYALVYGLLDKGFRALSNAFITRFLGDALNAGLPSIPRRFYVASAVAAVFSVPCGVYGAAIVSDGRYVPDWMLTFVLSFALMFMLWSTPGYLLILRSGKFKKSLLAISIIAIGNIVLNIILIPDFGAMSAAVNSLVSYLLWWLWTIHVNRAMGADRNLTIS